jgi:hypothetical protein
VAYTIAHEGVIVNGFGHAYEEQNINVTGLSGGMSNVQFVVEEIYSLAV